MSSEGFSPLNELDLGATVRGLLAGQKVLKRYILKKILGRGGMGVVWMAYDEKLELDIAIKFLPELVSHDRGTLRTLIEETRHCLRLNHPNIVRIYDFVQDEQYAGISMEYIEGDTLSNMRAEQPNKVFEPLEIQHWVRQVCSVLEYAHEEALVAHRDLKPANLMINQRGQLKVTDFGISRSLSDTVTRKTMAMQGASGTLVYMSPQQAMGVEVSASDDIYSLGATIYELLTSRPPFFTGDILAQIREKAAPSMAERRAMLKIEGQPIPKIWEEIVLSCLAKEPKDRPQNAREVMEQLGLTEVRPRIAPPSPARPAAPGTSEAIKPTPEGDEAPARTPTQRPATAASKPVTKTEAVPPKTAVLPPKTTKLADDFPPPEGVVQVRKSWLVAGMVAMLALIAATAYFFSNRQSQLEPGMGALQVDTIPSGATVTIPGIGEKTTPCYFWNLQPSSVELSVLIEKRGFESVTNKVMIRPDDVEKLSGVKLVPSGRAFFSSRPEGAKFILSGRALTPNEMKEGVRLVPGEHELVVSFPNWPTRTNRIRVGRGIPETNHFEFIHGAVVVDSVPQGADVLQDGKPVGKTPYTNEKAIPGATTFSLTYPGFTVDSVVTNILAEKTNHITRILTREAGTLVLTSRIPGVEFIVDGRSVGTLGSSLQLQTNVAPGTKQIVARIAGWPSQTNEVRLGKDQTRTVPFEFQLGYVTVESDPSGAQLKLNGTNRGTTPITLDVAPGEHTFELELADYYPEKITTNIAAGATVKLGRKLDRTRGYIEFTTSPADARVLFEGRLLSRLDNSVRAGSIVLDIMAEGHETKQVAVRVADGKTNVLDKIVLQRSTGGLSILSEPPGARFEVRVGADFRSAVTPQTLTNIPVGEYEVWLALTNYDTTNITVNVLSNQVTTRGPITLQRATGHLFISSTPSESELHISGEGIERRVAVGETLKPLPSGRYDVRVTAKDHYPTNFIVAIPPGGSVSNQVVLRKNTGDLQVIAVPDNARFEIVTLNGPVRGASGEARNLPVGSYEVLIQAPGYNPVRQPVIVRSNELAKLGPIHLIRSRGRLQITTTPPGANYTVYADTETLYERSPNAIDGVPVGRYQASVKLNGYRDTNFWVDIKMSATESISVTLERARGSLKFMTEPADATLEIVSDGTTVRGRAGETLRGLPSGLAQVRVTRAEYEATNVVVEVKADDVTNHGPVALHRSRGSLKLVTIPASARYWVETGEGRRSGVTPGEIRDLPTYGRYEVQIDLDGYEAKDQVFAKVERNSRTDLEVRLERTKGTIEIPAPLAGAMYRLEGPTNFENNVSKSGTLPAVLSDLPTGDYKLSVYLEQYEPAEQRVTVKPGRNPGPPPVSLIKGRGSVQVTASPERSNFEIRSAGTRVAAGVTPAVVTNLPVGNYSVSATFKNWSITNALEIKRNQTNLAALQLPFGKVRIESNPSGAAVMSGDRKLGETPLDLEEMPLGKVALALHKLNFRIKNVEGEVKAQQETKLLAELVDYPGPQPGLKVWENTLGMRFVPVGDVWFCVWETRVKDFEHFQRVTRHNAGTAWREPGFEQGSAYPVVNVSWRDAQAFCKWLTQKERSEGKLLDQSYRLPTDLEWSRAFGLNGETGGTPAERDGKVPGVFAWGSQLPPPPGVGNFDNTVSYDIYPMTSPVGSFRPNASGLFDLGGNVWEWCQDSYGGGTPNYVLRGESYRMLGYGRMLASFRRHLGPDERIGDIGFRIVVVRDSTL